MIRLLGILFVLVGLSGCGKDGKFVEYYESGKIQSEGNYKEGDGKYVGYDEDGNITDEDIYENGVCVKMCEGYCGDNITDRFDFCEPEK